MSLRVCKVLVDDFFMWRIRVYQQCVGLQVEQPAAALGSFQMSGFL